MKAFIYLDEYKMYSLSSQLFEGLTEYIVDTQSKAFSEEESQKGKLGSGRVMGNILRNESSKQEKKFLHDYAYTIFEKTLVNEKKILELDAYNIEEKINDLGKYDFIKIKGKAIFNDAKQISSSIENFNSFAGAIGYLRYKDASDEINEVKEQITQIKDRNKKVQAKMILNNSNFQNFLKEKGLYLEEKYLQEMVKVMNFGFRGQFEAQFPFLLKDGGVLFNSIINRSYLRETEESLIAKYSRQTEKEFCLFGLITQTQNVDDKKISEDFLEYLDNNFRELDEEGNTSSLGMKHAIFGLINALTNVENSFIGKAKYEYIIDPISVYREL